VNAIEGQEGVAMSDIEKVPMREEIELRAYEIYLKRGGKEGNALDDWLAAEKELSASRQPDASTPLVKRAAAS
jgi:Protein of unknown function (DUF2934)